MMCSLSRHLYQCCCWVFLHCVVTGCSFLLPRRIYVAERCGSDDYYGWCQFVQLVQVSNSLLCLNIWYADKWIRCHICMLKPVYAFDVLSDMINYKMVTKQRMRRSYKLQVRLENMWFLMRWMIKKIVPKDLIFFGYNHMIWYTPFRLLHH